MSLSLTLGALSLAPRRARGPAEPPLALTSDQWSTAPAYDGVQTAALTDTSGGSISQYYWTSTSPAPAWDGTGDVPAGIEPLRNDSELGWVLWWFSDRANRGTIAADDAAAPAWWPATGATIVGARIMRRNGAGVSEWSDAKDIALGTLPDVTADFGALTLSGAGAWPVPGATTTVAKTGGGTHAGEWTVSGLSLVPAQDGVTDGGTVELLVDGTDTIMVTINAVADAYSVAPGNPATVTTSYEQLEIALTSAQYGQRILCRGGDWGKARNAAGPGVWWIGHANASDPRALQEANGTAWNGANPVVIEPHAGETPVHWQLWLRNLFGVTVRDAVGAMTNEGYTWNNLDKQGPFVVYGENVEHIRLEAPTVRSTLADGSPARPWHWIRMGSYVVFDSGGTSSTADMPNCALVDGNFSGGCFTGAWVGGTNFQFERNTFYDIGEDAWKSNQMPLDGFRYNFNRFIRTSPRMIHMAEVSEIEYTANDIIVRFVAPLYDYADDAASAIDPTDTSGGWGSGWSAGFYDVPTAATAYVHQRHNVGIDYWNQALAVDNASITIPKVGQVGTFVRTDAMRNWLWKDQHGFIGTVATPGMKMAFTNVHHDQDEPRPPFNTAVVDDIHMIGNISVATVDENFGAGEVKGGLLRFQGLSERMRDTLIYGNISAVTGTYGLNLYGDGYAAQNGAFSLPWTPERLIPGADSFTKGAHAGEGQTAYSPGATRVSQNVYGEAVTSGTSGVMDQSNPDVSYIAAGGAYHGQLAADWFDDNLNGWLRGDEDVTDAMLDAPGLYVGRTGGVLEGFRATTAYFDPVNKTYDAAAMRAALAAGAYPPDAPGISITSTTAGVIDISLDTAADGHGEAILGYQWQLEASGGDFASPSQTGTNLQITAVTAGDWIVRMRAQSSRGWGPWSLPTDAVTVAASTAFPSAPLTEDGTSILGHETAALEISTGANRVLVVAITANMTVQAAPAQDWSLTWGAAGRTAGTGAALTASARMLDTHATSSEMEVATFYLAAPASGSGTLQIAGTADTDSFAVHVQEFIGIHQTTPVDVVNDTYLPASHWANTQSIPLTPTAAGGELFWAAAQRSGANRRITELYTVTQSPPVVVEGYGISVVDNALGHVYAFATLGDAPASEQAFDITWRAIGGLPRENMVSGVGVALRGA